NEMFKALLAGGEKRLTTAGDLGLPQVLSCGAIEVLVFNEPETVPPPFDTRTLIRHSPMITDVRLNGEEMARVGEEVAKRLQHTTSEAVFIIPTAGYDSYAVAGEGFHDPAADQAFVDALKANLPANIKVIERDTHIDDPAFATEAARLLIELIEKKGE
ncbi:MAG: Tm-1-like ATP-binding domain-containing protein, partial [Gammaproteobacteria bacterium]|nr:Tm-1-like ATP-binding domain-containing protein [Gammaproteobacteria bacterium]